MWDERLESLRKDIVYRELYSEDEARLFARPEIKLPTPAIAYASVVASFIFALILIFSHKPERHKKASSPSVKQSDSLPHPRKKLSEPNQPSVLINR